MLQGVSAGVLAMVVALGALLDAAPAGAAPAVAVSGFSDVPADHPFYAEISWLASQGISTGYADGTFRPTAPVSRAAMAAFLYRFAGEPAFTAPAVARFSDAPVGGPFYPEIMWLASQGISTGYADGTFRPPAAISRAAMAAFLYRVAGSPAFTPPATAEFTDVPTDHPFYAEVSWLAAQAITTGYADGSFRPTASISRAAMAAFMYRYDDQFGAPVLGPPVGSPGDTKNCSDFASWPEAQGWFDTYYPYYGDIAGLDGNNDGICCESLPGAP